MTVQRQVKVKNPLGVHARPAAKISQLASRFAADVELQQGELRANAKSVLGLMTLAAGYGTELTIRATGEDAEEAVAALAELFERGFDELEEE